MKILVGSIQQETNTFSKLSSEFEDFFYAEDEAVFRNIASYDLFRESGTEIIPTIYANAVPSGRLRMDVFDKLLNGILSRIPDDDIDGIWLYLHGALLLENDQSGELEILKAIKRKVKGDPIISLAIDFHANLPEQIVDHADIICGYKTAPHSDMEDTQRLSAKLLLKCLAEGVKPHATLVKLPLMLPGDTVLTAEYPMKSIMESSERLQSRNGFLDVSVFSGQSWVDCEHSGASVVITSYNDVESRKNAYDTAYRIAEDFWNVRGSFEFDQNALFPTQAIQAAWSSGKNQTFISDSGDNPTAGASGRRTDLLIEMQNHSVRDCVYGAVWDKDFVEFFQDKDIGLSNKMRLGENTQERLFKCTLKYKSRILNWDGADGGRSVLVNTGGIDVIVTENRISLISPEIFASAGVDITKYRMIAVKLGYLYPKLAQVASAHFLALTNGESCVNIESLHFNKLGRSVYPIDKKATFPCRKMIS